MTKAKEAKEPSLILYDSTKPQRIPLRLEKPGQTFTVYHNLEPLTNERYFEYQNDIVDLASRIKKISTAITSPQQKLWAELVTGRAGYKERDDWKEKTHPNDAVAAIAALLSVQVLDNSEIESSDKAAVYDEDELTVISFRALQSGVLMTLSHSFREETKAEADEFLAIDVGQADENNLAAAEKMSKQERLYRLGKKVLKETEGYAECEVPAWHLAATTETFFLRQASRMGKFLQP